MDVSATQVLSVMLTVFYYLLLPFLKLIQLLILALKPFLHTLNFILLPIIHLFQFVLQLILFPFIRFRGLELVEAMYIYLGVATIIGVSAGVILHVSFSVLAGMLNLDAPDAPVKPRARAAVTHPAKQRKKKPKAPRAPAAVVTEPPPYYSLLELGSPITDPNQPGLLGQTILEEEDSDL